MMATRGAYSERAPLDDAFTRAAGSPLLTGNAVRLLRDARENYPAWLDAIASATHAIDFECYIIHDDAAGAEFADALLARARDGVRVRVIYDWMGGIGTSSRRFWRVLRRGGVDVRCFNPLRVTGPLGWVHRDHRKSLTVDGRIGFVTGLCVGNAWVGDRAHGIEPWRDTGVEIRGPAVAEIERAFADVWATMGAPAAQDVRAGLGAEPQAGSVSLRVVAGTPGTAGLFRLEQLVAATARDRLWLTDAYFAGTPQHVESLRAAARDGVDVRLLVPGASDISILRPLSQSGYRPLLEAGVRVFEWNGPMIHAKTAVADGRWARVGSSNLNIASWLGNYELDAVIEDAKFASAMEEMYRADLERATEVIVRRERRRQVASDTAASSARAARKRGRHRRGNVRKNMGTATAGAMRLGRTVGAAVTGRRVLAPTEAWILVCAGLSLLLLGAAAVRWPRIAVIPLAVIMAWCAIGLIAQGAELYRSRTSSIGAARSRTSPLER